MQKSMKAFIIVISILLTAVVLASAGLSVATFMRVDEIKLLQAAQKAENEEVDVENGVTIGGSYVIHSTKTLSDAYLAGDTSALSDRDRETVRMADEVLSSVVSSGMSDYEKEQAVFKWISDNISNDGDVTVLVRDNVTTDNPHDVLATRRAVCVGYATTFRLFMQMLDIPCMVIHDTDHIHAWDLVQIDGGWYHADPYRAAGSRDPLQFLNRNDLMQRDIDFSWDTARFPKADSLEYCYAHQHAENIKEAYEIPSRIKDAVDSGTPFVSLLIKKGEDTEQLVGSTLYIVDERVIPSAEYDYISLTHSVTADGDYLFIYIKIEDSRTDSTDSGELIVTDEQLKKINEAVRDSFGSLSYYD